MRRNSKDFVGDSDIINLDGYVKIKPIHPSLTDTFPAAA